MNRYVLILVATATIALVAMQALDQPVQHDGASSIPDVPLDEVVYVPSGTAMDPLPPAWAVRNYGASNQPSDARLPALALQAGDRDDEDSALITTINIGEWADVDNLTLLESPAAPINVGERAVPLAVELGSPDAAMNVGTWLPPPDADQPDS